jgi:hypothetical protein
LLKHETTEETEEANLTLGKVNQRFQTLGTLPHLLRSVLGAQRPLLGFLLAPGQLFDLLIDLLSDPCGLLSGFLHASLGFGLGVYRLLAARFKLSVQSVDALLSAFDSTLLDVNGWNFGGLGHKVSRLLLFVVE